MDQRILKEILAQYEEKRRAHEAEEARRREEIAKKHPDLNCLLEQRHEMVMGSVRDAFLGEQAQTAEARMAEYNRAIAEGLRRCGYPADYLAPIQDCPQCGDTGFYYDAGSVRRPCECLKKAYLAALSTQEEAGRGEACFANFDENRFPQEPLPGSDVTQREYMRVVREKCLRFAQNVPQGRCKTLLLHGGSGLGKTFLLHCIEQEARARGVDTLYATAYDLLMALKTAYFSYGGDSAADYFEVSLLLIDDLGMEPLMENVTVEQIYNLLNSRLTRGLPTAISTNLSRTELQQRYTERVSSRLLDSRTGQAIAFYGRDIRLVKER